ncbi:F-box only protein 15 [Balamuthia mandrillaris]
MIHPPLTTHLLFCLSKDYNAALRKSRILFNKKLIPREEYERRKLFLKQQEEEPVVVIKQQPSFSWNSKRERRAAAEEAEALGAEPLIPMWCLREKRKPGQRGMLKPWRAYPNDKNEMIERAFQQGKAQCVIASKGKKLQRVVILQKRQEASKYDVIRGTWFFRPSTSTKHDHWQPFAEEESALLESHYLRWLASQKQNNTNNKGEESDAGEDERESHDKESLSPICTLPSSASVDVEKMQYTTASSNTGWSSTLNCVVSRGYPTPPLTRKQRALLEQEQDQQEEEEEEEEK